MNIEFPPTIVNASQMERGQNYLPVSKQRFIHERHSLEQWAVQLAARHHPHNQKYDVPAAVRAVVHAYERPGSVVCGFSALALYGLPYLVEGADTTLRAPTPQKLTASAIRPSVARLHAPHTQKHGPSPTAVCPSAFLDHYVQPCRLCNKFDEANTRGRQSQSPV